MNDKSVYYDFCEHIQFKNGRYEVALPWKQPLYQKTTTPVCSNISGETLEYNKVIRGQVQQEIVKVMPSGGPDVDGVTYLPHHAVIRRDKATT